MYVCTCARVAGASTEAQLRNVFLKCVTPGADINVGAIGGSITEHDDSWAGNFSALLSHLCPRAQVRMHNGARASHGALTLGLCARAVMAPELDIAMLEFSLNDQGQYTLPNGTFSSLPYELATRTVLTGTDPTPAVFGISFWGRSFTYDSAQPYHEEVHKLYGVTGISLRDMVWPYFSKGRAPFATKADVCSDVHHPNAFVHGLTAQVSAHTNMNELTWKVEVEVQHGATRADCSEV
ncbi:hypothetical protein JKP88DRAFT_206975 [Tribonema minus]|uniref:SGNH hydrolase-type esterase domain-containing protein n=1 Tax=Tribonema minus TaxID=303371 RepID=A0A835Z775_9STRA|nr:hypothetical protein JKP88DRAFT_206975 [Tribonema minus]